VGVRVRQYRAAIRLIVARCAVDYTARLTAHLPEALRLIMVKADGSVLVHADAGGYKPLNCSYPCDRGASATVCRTVAAAVG
jgi:endonuclease